jgi:hypothetical protein
MMKRAAEIAAKVTFTVIACTAVAWWLYGPRSR